MKVIEIDLNICQFCKQKVLFCNKSYSDCSICYTQIDLSYYNNKYYIKYFSIDHIIEKYNKISLNFEQNKCKLFKYDKVFVETNIPENFELSKEYLESLFNRYNKLCSIS